MRAAAGVPAAVLLALGGERLLHAHRQDAPVVQTLGQHAHAGVVDVRIGGAHLRGLEAGGLRAQHGLVDVALQLGEPAVDRECAGDVGRVQAVGLHARIDEQQVAVAHHTGVAHPMQDRGVRAGGDDRVIADLVALLARNRVERALKHAFGTLLVDHMRQGLQDPVEALLRGGHGLAHLADLVGVLDHARLGGHLVQLVVGGGVGVRIGEAVRLAHALDQLGDRGVGLADHAHAHRAGLGADVLADRIGQLGDVMGLQTGHRGQLLQTGARADPVLAVLGGGVVLLGAVVGARRHEQFGRMRPAGLGLLGIRVHRVEHQHGARLVVLAQAGVIGEGGVRTEGVIAVVGAHFRRTGRNHDALARELRAQRVDAGLDVLAGLQRLDLGLLIIPARGHEMPERLAGRPQRAVVHTVGVRLRVSRRGRRLTRLVLLVLVGHDFAH